MPIYPGAELEKDLIVAHFVDSYTLRVNVIFNLCFLL